MSASKLAKPDKIYKESFLAALDEFQQEDRYSFLDANKLNEDFDGFVKNLRTNKISLHKPYRDWVEPVPESCIWLVKDYEYIGTINIRHRLNWHLEKWGGHVSFVIRPSMRGKGFGKKILQRAIPAISYLGIERALLTLNPDNKAAIRIVEFCGGTFSHETPKTDKFPARKCYWINCQ